MNIETVTTWLEWISVNQPGASWPGFLAIVLCALWLRRWWPMPAKWHKEKGHRWYWPADKLALLATWPARKAWGWWKRRRAGEGTECNPTAMPLIGVWRNPQPPIFPEGDAAYYEVRFRGAYTPKQVAPNTPYGSKPSGEPEWRRAVDELEGRVAALEGKKPPELSSALFMQPKAPEYRVFRDGPYITLRRRDGVEALSLNGMWAWVIKGLEGRASEQAELPDGPERDAIVAEYLAWSSPKHYHGDVGST